MKVICLGNYPPRQCGIATFTENLVSAIKSVFQTKTKHFDIEVIAMNDGENIYPYPEIVHQTLKERQPEAYLQISKYINQSGADLLLLQHEYGIYGGESGVLLLSLLRNVKIPLVTTLHTVLQKPNFHQYEVLKTICGYSNRIVVMNSLAVDFLNDIYNVPRSKITRIEHGVPDFSNIESKLIGRPQEWNNRRIMLTFGLIGRSKGIETVIRALPAIVNKHPDILYVVLGKTHPHILRNSGEEYRNYLLNLANNLKVNKHLIFINEYVNEINLMSYLREADIYITPYLNKSQITSGTLSYAVSAGCAVISTPYWHAEELLAEERGLFFGFGKSEELAEKVNFLLNDPLKIKQLQVNAFNYGKKISWSIIGSEYINLFKDVLNSAKGKTFLPRQYLPIQYPVFDYSHLKRLTDETGLIQHARACVPNYQAGYSLDDNARAIIFSLKAWKKTGDNCFIALLHKYLAYTAFMQQKDGSFKNYMTYDRRLLDEKSDDAFGRVVWALGYLIRYYPTNSIFYIAHELYEHSMSQLKVLWYARGFANCIFGLYHYLKRFPDHEKYLNLFVQISDQLCDKYTINSKKNWNWFEDTLTYDNGLLPCALYRAYEITSNQKYLQIADESRIFLESKCFKKNWLSLIGNRKWLHYSHEYDAYAQQPVDAMAMILLYEAAWDATAIPDYIEKMLVCFDWFFGRNDLNISLYDNESKGCNDGIEEFNINRNQGAESNLAYLISWLVTEPFFKKL